MQRLLSIPMTCPACRDIQKYKERHWETNSQKCKKRFSKMMTAHVVSMGFGPYICSIFLQYLNRLANKTASSWYTRKISWIICCLWLYLQCIIPTCCIWHNTKTSMTETHQIKWNDRSSQSTSVGINNSECFVCICPIYEPKEASYRVVILKIHNLFCIGTNQRLVCFGITHRYISK